jgi:hypothetical protein
VSTRRIIIWDYDSEETGFVLLEGKVLARSLSYGEIQEQKRLLELEEKQT